MIIPAAAGFWVEYNDPDNGTVRDPVIAWEVVQGNTDVIVTPISIWGRVNDFLDVIGPAAPTA